MCWVSEVILTQNCFQIADAYHPYGYSNMKYVASLISGVGIFCVGTGLSFYHGISGLINPQPLDDLFWVIYFTLEHIKKKCALFFRNLNRYLIL